MENVQKYFMGKFIFLLVVEDELMGRTLCL